MAGQGGFGFFGKTKPEDVLELLVDEVAGSLSLLSPFQLNGQVTEDEVVNDRPGADESVRIAIRFGFKTPRGARMGFLLIPLQDALALADQLLMLPLDQLREEMAKTEPHEGEKEALMEVGELLGNAFHQLLKKRLPDETKVKFLGCQGVAEGEAPWVSGYGGEPIAVRRHAVQFEGLDSFEMLVAIPA